MVALIATSFEESDWLLKNFDQSENGWKTYHGEQDQGYHMKERENCVRSGCQYWAYILFEANYWENKQCLGVILE